MSELTDELRNIAAMAPTFGPILNEAADEIVRLTERLRVANEEAQRLKEELEDLYDRSPAREE